MNLCGRSAFLCRLFLRWSDWYSMYSAIAMKDTDFFLSLGAVCKEKKIFFHTDAAQVCFSVDFTLV